jgi:hypothetical protein
MSGVLQRLCSDADIIALGPKGLSTDDLFSVPAIHSRNFYKIVLRCHWPCFTWGCTSTNDGDP